CRIADRAAVAGRAARILHGGILCAAAGIDAAAQRRRSDLDTGELSAALRRWRLPPRVLDDIAYRTDRDAGRFDAGLPGGSRNVAPAAARCHCRADRRAAAVLDQRSGAQLRVDGVARA